MTSAETRLALIAVITRRDESDFVFFFFFLSIRAARSLVYTSPKDIIVTYYNTPSITQRLQR